MKIFDVTKDKLDYDFRYNPEETSELKSIFSEIRENETLSINDLRRVALWKIDRVLNIPQEIILALSNLAKQKDLDIHDEKTKKVISDLLQCDGVGLPMASTILKFLRPDIFPIIDIRSYRAIFGKKIYSSQYSIEIYYNYIEEIYKIKEKTGLELERIDEQLYEYDKKYTGKI
jgi:hypothetical protein